MMSLKNFHDSCTSQCSTLVHNTVVRATFKVNGKPPVLGSHSPLTPWPIALTRCCKLISFFIFNVSYMPMISSSILQWELIGSWSPFVVIGNLKMITVSNLGNNYISRQETARDVGIYTDSSLTFSSHMSQIVAKAHARASVIHKCFLSKTETFSWKHFM